MSSGECPNPKDSKADVRDIVGPSEGEAGESVSIRSLFFFDKGLLDGEIGSRERFLFSWTTRALDNGLERYAAGTAVEGPASDDETFNEPIFRASDDRCSRVGVEINRE